MGGETTKDAALRVLGRRGDPEGIALVVAREVPGSEVERHRGTWRVCASSKKSLFRGTRRPELVVEVDGACFDGGKGPRQRDEVRQEIAASMRGPGLERVLGMIPEVRIAVSFLADVEGRIPVTHPMYAVALDVATRTDGFVLDLHNGRVLSAAGEVWGSRELAGEGAGPADPSIARIGSRLVVLFAVAARCLTEYDGRDIDEARDGIVAWVHGSGATVEPEDFEVSILQRPARGLDEEALAFGSWQIEGAAALAWALGLLPSMPPHDHPVDPAVVSGALGFPDVAATAAALRASTRRHPAVVDAEAARQYAIYWRLREFVAKGEALDLESFARSGQQGPLRFDRVPLLGGDLAVGEKAIADADPDVVEVSLGIVGERLRALNWLGRGGLYSAVELTP
ncbi:MAG TPA: DUF4272 domain-containing protein [Acidimicrobiales bacterium]|nr:DUF4272 domain-containing protein [Acidimicrobiales bacterium]